MLTIYSIFIEIYFFGIKIYSTFNKKAGKFIKGRENWKNELKKNIPVSKKVIWFHCASLGEFEQGRPVMELLKKNSPNDFLLLTFFSPSGYEVRKNYPVADFVFYLPKDSKQNAIDFISLCNPSLVLFVKYEFWFNFINQLNKRNIPLIFFSCNFRENQFLFKWYGNWALKYLKTAKAIFVQNISSKEILEKNNFTNVEVAFDTRFDRVKDNSMNINIPNNLKEWIKNHFVLVFGSTWPEDEKIILQLIDFLNLQKLNFKYIVVPHNIDEISVKKSLTLFKDKNPILYSQLRDQNKNLLIVDNVGMLSSLYSLANIAYVGGGFGSGIHNILEAAVFEIPIVIGPKNSRFLEAIELKLLNSAFEINNSEEMNEIFLELITNKSFRLDAGVKAKKYVEERVGGSREIIEFIQQLN